MSHVPLHATVYTVDVPDEEVARDLAQVLVERGHAVVRMAPRSSVRGSSERLAGSWWRVIGLDEGPYPSDDEHWWMATEERVISGLAEEHGGGYTCSQAQPAVARRFLVKGEILTDRTVDQVREVRIAALAREPARVPAPVIVHQLKNPEPSAGPIGEPVAFRGLDDVDWSSYSHAYGSARDVPELLWRLAANDEGWDEAMDEYFSAVVHQGTCYDSTPQTIRFLVQLACAPQLVPECRLRLLIDLAYLAITDPAPACGEEIDDSSSCEAVTCQEIINCLPYLLALWPAASTSVRAWLIVLAALRPSTATALLADFQEFRRQVEGPSPALDLALAMCAHHGDDALDLTLHAAAWDDEIPGMLKEPEPLRARHLKVLVHLSMAELAPGSSA